MATSSRRGCLGRWIAITLLGLLFVAVLGFVFLDTLLERGIEQAGRLALGVETSVEDVELSAFDSQAAVLGLRVANPEGFGSDHFLELREASVQLDSSSLRSDTLVIEQLRLSGLDLCLERQAGRTNFGQILESLQKLQGSQAEGAGKGGSGGDTPAGPGRRYLVRELVLEDLQAHVELVPLVGRQSVRLKSLVLRDLDSGAASSGLSLAELVGRIVEELLGATLAQSPELFPADLRQQLEGQLDLLDGGLLEQLDEVRQTLQEGAKQGLDSAKQGLKDLFGK